MNQAILNSEDIRATEVGQSPWKQWDLDGRFHETCTTSRTRFSWNGKSGRIFVHPPCGSPVTIGEAGTEEAAKTTSANWAAKNLIN